MLYSVRSKKRICFNSGFISVIKLVRSSFYPRDR